ncbi:MAG: carotenoid oxygenase family protein [Hyphomonadaceae bacterium]
MSSPVESAIRGVVTSGIMGVANINRALRRRKGPNPYLTGLHEPLTSEATFTDLQVTGAIPAELNGVYLRNGPNPLKAPNAATHHWFIGEAMIHGVRLQDGKALWYRNRWVRSNAVSDALGETRAPGPRHARTDVANTNIIGHAGKLWAIVEAGGHPVEMGEDLSTVAHSTFEGTLGRGVLGPPASGPRHGRTVRHLLRGAAPDHDLAHGGGRGRQGAPQRADRGAGTAPMIHDCMITASYVVVMDLPVTFSMQAVLKPGRVSFRWNPKHAARIGPFAAREGAGEDIVWCEVDPCFIFHPANAFEREDGVVVMDACVHPSMFEAGATGPDSLACPFERLEIDPRTRRVTRTVIDAAPQEFPRPDERRIGKPYRYAYCMALPENQDPAFVGDPRLYRHDLETGEKLVRDFGEGRMPGEFVFIPARPDSAEDVGLADGFL